MFRFIALAAAAVAVAVAAVLVYAAAKPDSFEVRRQARIDAPPEAIYPLIADFRRYGAWSPYETLDPGMKRSYSGAPNGNGAVYAWESAGDAGIGQMEITDASPPSRLAIRLDFVKPFEAHNLVEFTLEPDGDATTVTWAMRGEMPYVAKLMSTFFGIDALVGQDFETGLARLKALAES